MFTERYSEDWLNDIRKVTGIRMSQAFYGGANPSHEMNKTFLHEVYLKDKKIELLYILSRKIERPYDLRRRILKV